MTRNDRDGQKAARRRQQQTGEPYQDALAYIREAWQRLDRDLHYVLSGDVEAFMRGVGWRGTSLDEVEDMRAWFGNLKPTYGAAGAAKTATPAATTPRCNSSPPPTTRTCTRSPGSSAPGATTPVSAVQGHMGAAGGRPAGPRVVTLEASARPEIEAEITRSAQPVVVPGLFDFELEDLDDPEATEPALLISAVVTDDRGQGAGPWLTELELAVWRPAGFDLPLASAQAEPGWSVRVVDGYYSSTLAPQWVAVRMSDPEEGHEPHHLYLGAIDIPEAWREAVRAHERLLLLVEPLQSGGTVPEIAEKIDPAQLVELFEEGALLAAYVPVELDEREATAGHDDSAPRTFLSTPDGLMELG
ncbi:hypothetical protein [Nonomuraea sp. NPDC003754]